MDTINGEDDQVALTKDVRASLRAERARTGVTAIQLLSDASDLPGGLTAGAVNRWMNGLMRTAPRLQLDYILARWAAMPDSTNGKRGKAYPVSADEWIEVTPEMSAQLRAELVRTGIDHATLLDAVDAAPPGLNARVVKAWLYQEAQTTRAAHWGFVIEHLRGIPGARRSPTEPHRKS